MFFVGVVFKLAACSVGMVHLSRLRRQHDPRSGAQPVASVPRIPDDELPVFTILVPAYREANVVSKVIEHVRELDYPMSKLQVLLLMEADDDETIAAAKVARPPDLRPLRRRPTVRTADEAEGLQRRAGARRR